MREFREQAPMEEQETFVRKFVANESAGGGIVVGMED